MHERSLGRTRARETHLKLLIRCANVLLDRASQSAIELDQCDVSDEESILRKWDLYVPLPTNGPNGSGVGRR